MRNSLCGRQKQHAQILRNNFSSREITDDFDKANAFNDMLKDTVGRPIDPLHNDHCLKKASISDQYFFYPMTS